jgi:hypothetical protein
MGIKERFKGINARLSKRPADSVELVAGEGYLKDVKAEILGELLAETADVGKRLDFLFHEFLVTDTVLRPVGITFSWARRIDGLLKGSERELKTSRERLEEDFRKQREAYMAELREIMSEVSLFDKKGASYNNKGELQGLTEHVTLVQEIEGQLSKAQDRATEINEEEERLGWNQTDFELLKKASDVLSPFAKLWKTADNFSKSYRKWFHGSVYGLDGEQVQKDVDEMWRTSSSSSSCRPRRRTRPCRWPRRSRTSSTTSARTSS